MVNDTVFPNGVNINVVVRARAVPRHAREQPPRLHVAHAPLSVVDIDVHPMGAQRDQHEADPQKNHQPDVPVVPVAGPPHIRPPSAAPTILLFLEEVKRWSIPRCRRRCRRTAVHSLCALPTDAKPSRDPKACNPRQRKATAFMLIAEYTLFAAPRGEGHRRSTLLLRTGLGRKHIWARLTRRRPPSPDGAPARAAPLPPAAPAARPPPPLAPPPPCAAGSCGSRP